MSQGGGAEVASSVISAQRARTGSGRRNRLDALRAFEADTVLTEALGSEISAAFVKLKRAEWASYAASFSPWERDTTLDI